MNWLLADLLDYPGQLSDKDITKLRKFYMVQQALSRELQAGKPLGICKTITSGVNPLVRVSIDDILGKKSVSKEMLS